MYHESLSFTKSFLKHRPLSSVLSECKVAEKVESLRAELLRIKFAYSQITYVQHESLMHGL